MASKRKQRRDAAKGGARMARISGEHMTPDALVAHRELELLRASARTRKGDGGELIAQRQRLLEEARQEAARRKAS